MIPPDARPPAAPPTSVSQPSPEQRVAGDVPARVADLDPSLFDPLPSQTSPDDRRALLALHRSVAEAFGRYAYLEIGSYRGGSLQPHVRDPRCGRIFSVDLRPELQPDEMHGAALCGGYDHVSAASMRASLAGIDPGGAADAGKLVTFECDARDVGGDAVDPRPHLCFIDGEHTSAAVRSDFAACRRLARPDATVAFHDVPRVVPALGGILRDLTRDGVPHTPLMLPGVVFAIALGEAPTARDPRLREMSRSHRRYFAVSRLHMFYQRTLRAPGAGAVKPLLRPLVRRLRGR